HDVGPELVARLADHRRDPAGVARDVPDREIELGHGDAQGVGHAGGSMRGEPRKYGPTRPTPPASQRLPRPTAGLPLPHPTACRRCVRGAGKGTCRSQRRTTCPHPNPPPQAGEGAGPGAGGAELGGGGSGSGSGNKGPRRPRPTACPSPACGGRLGGGHPPEPSAHRLPPPPPPPATPARGPPRPPGE